MRPISNCLNPKLAEICERAIQLEELSYKISQLLPENLASVCQVGSFNKGQLILTVQDANWASQLRYLIPELRDRLRTEAKMHQLISIKIAINSQGLYQKLNPVKTPAISEKAKAAILKESNSCSYQPLKKALLNLAD